MMLIVSLNGRQRRVAVFPRINNAEGVGQAVFVSLKKRSARLEVWRASLSGLKVITI